MDTRPPVPSGKSNRRAWLLALSDEDFWRTAEELRLVLMEAVITKKDERHEPSYWAMPDRQRNDMLRWLSYSDLPPFRDPEGRQGGPPYRDADGSFSPGVFRLWPEDDHWAGEHVGRRVGRVTGLVRVIIDGPDENWTWRVRKLDYIRALE